jgi:hypothetical protein
LKERVVDASYDPIAWIGRKITRRPAPLPASEAWKLTGAAHAQPGPARPPAGADPAGPGETRLGTGA